MQFNVADMLKEGYGAVREYDIDDDVRFDGVTHHFTGSVRFDRTHDGVLVRARLHGTSDAECARCLRGFGFPIDLEIEEEYIPTVDLNGGRVQPPEGEEDAYRISERHIIDLREPVEQYWALALPIAPVCREECRGLCADCGAELGEAHACAAAAADDRWAKLRDLKLG